jgi:hypothetical protein
VNPGGLKDLQITEGTLGVIEKAFRKRREYGKLRADQGVDETKGRRRM